MPRTKFDPLDLFLFINVVAFVVTGSMAAMRGEIAHRGVANVVEFTGYAFIIAILAFCLWRVFRGRRLHFGVIALTQIAIAAHFAGGFVPVNGHRLYDAYFLGVRFDKYVHLLNGLAGVNLADALIARRDRPVVHGTLIFLAMMGGGAIVELCEYAAFRAVPGNGVGGYDNNMQDMLANGLGGILYLVWRWTAALAAASRSRAPAPRI